MSDGQDAGHSTVDEQGVIGGQSPSTQSRAEREQARAAQDFSHSQAGNKLSIGVKVYSPFRDYYDGQASSVSAENDTGPFDILPKHHNFISLLRPCDLIIRTVREGDKKIIISGGIMHVKADRVIVFLDV
ncbi:MAG TPA: F0F1 ATP synthase subunit epsilon [Candidatus Saccharimonadales bacterium]|nr:F0F1 ATP synthase subunit epsilon [Candidatus Saccharimonadales bacterium]